MAKFEVPEGWTVQAFRFTLDPTEEQACALARHFGARRKAFNWHSIGPSRHSKPTSKRGTQLVLRRRSRRCGCCGNAGTRSRTRCARTPRPGRCGGRSARNRRTPTESPARWTPTGIGSSPVPAGVLGNESGFRGSSARAAMLTGCASLPARCGSSLTAAISRCR